MSIRKTVDDKRRIGQETVNTCCISVMRPCRVCFKQAVAEAAGKYEYELNGKPV
jgi:hypothetical protein